MSRHLRGFLLASAFLLLALPVAAEEAWVAEMPGVTDVNAATQGTDAFDTAARQWVAYSNLFETTMALIGDRYTAGKMTDVERQLRDTYNGNTDRVLRELKASLPEDQRDFFVGTRFAEWSALRDRYIGDRAFNNKLLETFFSAQFRATNGQVLKAKWLTLTGFGLTPAPRPNVVYGIGGVLVVPVLALVGFLIPVVLKRGRMALDSKDVFKLHLGGGTYALNHVTGTVENSSKLATTSVYGGGGGGSAAGGFSPITVSSSTTVHDQFFIKRADGRVESVQLQGWDFPIADGHKASAVWAIREGKESGPFVVIRDHTTGDASFAANFMSMRVMRASGTGLWLLELILVGALAFAVSTLMPIWQAFATAAIGAFVGSLIWHVTIKPRFLAGFRRSGLPRLYAELDRIAAADATA